MQKLLLALGTVCLITFATPALSQETTTPAANNDNASQVRADDDDFDIGWLGLLGLLGLAGLMGRRHVDRTTTVRH